MKECTSCRNILPLSQFNQDSRKQYAGRNKLRAECKTCHSQCQVAGYKRRKGSISWVKEQIRTVNRRSGTKPDQKRLEILTKQLYKKLLEADICPYTNQKLIAGENLSLDHRMPLSRFPEQALNIDNLQWVSRQYNMAKHKMTDEEFMDFIVLIIKNAGYTIVKMI